MHRPLLYRLQYQKILWGILKKVLQQKMFSLKSMTKLEDLTVVSCLQFSYTVCVRVFLVPDLWREKFGGDHPDEGSVAHVPQEQKSCIYNHCHGLVFRDHLTKTGILLIHVLSCVSVATFPEQKFCTKHQKCVFRNPCMYIRNKNPL